MTCLPSSIEEAHILDLRTYETLLGASNQANLFLPRPDELAIPLFREQVQYP